MVAEGMTAQNSSDSQPAASQQSKLIYCLTHVFGTAGSVTAVGSQEWR